MRNGEAGHCSSLCADQWPKSSGRADPSSKGSPEVGDVFDVKFRAAANDLLQRASVSKRARFGGALDLGEEGGVADQRDLDRLDQAARFSGAGRGSRKSLSLITAKGGANVPMKFFLPKALMPFFTPTPPSAWLRLVVGRRISARRDGLWRRQIRRRRAARRRRWREVGMAVDAVAARFGDRSSSTRSRLFLAASPPGTEEGRCDEFCEAGLVREIGGDPRHRATWGKRGRLRIDQSRRAPWHGRPSVR